MDRAWHEPFGAHEIPRNPSITAPSRHSPRTSKRPPLGQVPLGPHLEKQPPQGLRRPPKSRNTVPEGRTSSASPNPVTEPPQGTVFRYTLPGPPTGTALQNSVPISLSTTTSERHYGEAAPFERRVAEPQVTGHFREGIGQPQSIQVKTMHRIAERRSFSRLFRKLQRAVFRRLY